MAMHTLKLSSMAHDDSVGDHVGTNVGETVGDHVGEMVGDLVGTALGVTVGDGLGPSVRMHNPMSSHPSLLSQQLELTQR